MLVSSRFGKSDYGVAASQRVVEAGATMARSMSPR